MGPLFLFMLFGLALFIVSFFIPYIKDPRESPFFNYRGHPLRGLSLEEARVRALESAKILRIIGLVLFIVCAISFTILCILEK